MSDLLNKMNLTLVPIQNKDKKFFRKDFRKNKNKIGVSSTSKKSAGKRELKTWRAVLIMRGGLKANVKSGLLIALNEDH